MDKMGATNGVGLIVYTGSRDDLQRKLRERDDRITELEAVLRELAEWASGEPDAPIAMTLSIENAKRLLDGECK